MDVNRRFIGIGPATVRVRQSVAAAAAGRLNQPPSAIHRDTRGIVQAQLNCTGLQICKDHCSKERCKDTDCRSLHICIDYVLSNCFYGGKCNNGHVLTDAHNRAVFHSHGLERGLPLDALRELMRRNRTEVTLPKACSFYNTEKGCSKPTEGKNACQYLHVCQHFLTDNCKYGTKCKRSHQLDANSHSKTILERYSMSGAELLGWHRGSGAESSQERMPSSRKFSGDSISSPRAGQAAQSTNDDDPVICTFNLLGKCNYGSKCRNHHSKLPYQWQVEDDGKWQDYSSELSGLLEEKFYNGHLKLMLRGENVNFENFTIGPKKKLRRLGTESAAKSKRAFATEWEWYWMNDNRQWTPYGGQGHGGRKAATNGGLLEEQYQNYLDGRSNWKFNFDAGNDHYEVDFRVLRQKNLETGMLRSIIRRPKVLMTTALFDRKLAEFKQQRVKQSAKADSDYPSEWDMSSRTVEATSESYQLAQVASGSPEYAKVVSAFQRHFQNAVVEKIERIQNRDLYDDYARMKKKMEKKAQGGTVLEKLLFHGTTPDKMSAICQQGFDHRVAGLSTGTLYGQGTYFSTSAQYSDSYTRCNQMLVVSVLVGDFTIGKQEYKRPPPKDPKSPYGELYDSVVDKCPEPTIYVIFDNHQSYPNYIVHYSRK